MKRMAIGLSDGSSALKPRSQGAKRKALGDRLVLPLTLRLTKVRRHERAQLQSIFIMRG